MQYRRSVGVSYPSPEKTCPRWLWHVAQTTSVRVIPRLLSVRSMMRSPANGVKKLGHPQCESNFPSLRKSSVPQARQRYTPTFLLSVYSPVNGRSVPAWRSTWYSSGLSSARHCASVLLRVGAGSLAIIRRYPAEQGSGMTNVLRPPPMASVLG